MKVRGIYALFAFVVDGQGLVWFILQTIEFCQYGVYLQEENR
jgi:hypothetical protein